MLTKRSPGTVGLCVKSHHSSALWSLTTKTATEQPALKKENLIIFLQKSTPCQQNHHIATLKQRCQKYHPREQGELPCHSYLPFPHQAVSGSTKSIWNSYITVIYPPSCPVPLMLALTGTCHFLWILDLVHWTCVRQARIIRILQC